MTGDYDHIRIVQLKGFVSGYVQMHPRVSKLIPQCSILLSHRACPCKWVIKLHGVILSRFAATNLYRPCHTPIGYQYPHSS